MALDPRSRLEAAKKNVVCFGCLQTCHIIRNCARRSYCQVRILNNQPCGKRHHEKLHAEINGVSKHNIINEWSMRKNALIMIGDVTSGNKKTCGIMGSWRKYVLDDSELHEVYDLRIRNAH